MDDIRGKVVVVTGAASGIGRALATRAAADGAKVVLADVEESALESAAEELAEAGAEALGVRTDVAVAAEVDALRDAALDAYGAVHVVCNNAGVSAGGLTWEHSLDDWSWVLGVNLWGVIHGVRSFTPLLREQDEGHIVNTASMAGLTSPPFMAAYNVSKHGVVTLSETMYAELGAEGSAVGVSVLCPGWVNTRIHEADRNRSATAASTEADPAEAGPEEPDPEEPGLRDMVGSLLASGLDPARVADLVFDAVREKRFYVLTHPDWNPMISGRTDLMVSGQNPGGTFLPT